MCHVLKSAEKRHVLFTFQCAAQRWRKIFFPFLTWGRKILSLFWNLPEGGGGLPHHLPQNQRPSNQSLQGEYKDVKKKPIAKRHCRISVVSQKITHGNLVQPLKERNKSSKKKRKPSGTLKTQQYGSTLPHHTPISFL